MFIELKRRGEEPYYWQGKNEVDFVVKERDNSLTAINVTYGDEIDERKIAGLREFKQKFKKARRLLLLARDSEGKREGVQLVPLWKWLLRE